MNLERLHQAEEEFLNRYPGGFSNPALEEVLKKHKMGKMVALTQEAFDQDQFEYSARTLENLVKVVSQSSMVAMFEKPKFRDFARSLNDMERDLLVDAWLERLHGNEQAGFEMILDMLEKGRVAKWTLMTIVPTYYRPTTDVFVKPTTVKGIIKTLEIDKLVYKPAPTWDFYSSFRDMINDVKGRVDPSLSPSNAAFTGFLMSTI